MCNLKFEIFNFAPDRAEKLQITNYKLQIKYCSFLILFFALVAPARAATAFNWDTRAATPLNIGGGLNEGRLMTEAGTDTIFAMRGDNAATLYRYIISQDAWSQMTDLTGTLAGGGTLELAGSDTIFVLSGGLSQAFTRYVISADAWTAMLDIPQVVQGGGALVTTGDDTIFATPGVGTMNFYQYTISTNTWTAMLDAPGTIDAGAALAQAGSDTIFALRGGLNPDFYRYIISSNTWSAMTSLPVNVQGGGSLLYPGSGNFIYATRGDNSSDMYRYSISGNNWTLISDTAPNTFQAGGGLVYPGSGNFLYGLHGGISTSFSRFYLDSAAPNTPTGLAQTKPDMTPIALNDQVTDTNSIRFNIFASGTGSETFRIQVELRAAGTAFTSPANPAIDTITFFQSAPSASSGGETLSILADSLANGQYHWQARAIGGSAGVATSWVTFDAADTHFRIALTGNLAPTIVPLPPQSRNEDTAAWTVTLTPFGNDTNFLDVPILFWSVTGGGTVVTVSMDDSQTLRITPIADRNGTETVTVRLSDNKDTTSDTLAITLAAVNDTPFISSPSVPAQSRVEDTVVWTIALTPFTNDTDAGDTLIAFWTVSGGGSIVTVSMNDSRTLRIAPRADSNGTETVTLRLSDTSETVTQFLAITLTPVNDTPVAGTITISDSTIRPIDSTFLRITGSTDTDIATNGDTFTYLWSVVSGPGGAFTDTTSDSTYFIPLAATDGTNVLRVTVRDSALLSDSRSTTVLVDSFPPFGFAPSAPAHGHETTATTITFTWTAASDTGAGFDSYRIQIDSSTSFANPKIDSAVGTSTSSSRTLTAGETWYWRIVARDTVGNSSTSDSFRLRINITPNDTPTIFPTAPAQSRPEDTVVWTVALSPFTNDSSPADSIIAFWSVTGGGGIFMATMLDSRTLRISPTADSNGTETVTLRLSDNKDTITQLLAITLTVVNDTPTAGTISISDSTIRPIDSTFLRITGSFDVDTATNGDSLTYVWSVVSGPGGAFTDTTSDSTYFIPLAATDGANVLRVTVRDSALASDSRSTTVLVDSFPPFGFGPSAPAHGHETSATTITFTWSAASDTGAGFDSYRLQIDSSIAFTNPFVDSPMGTSTSSTRTLATNETWYWRIIARDTVGNTRTSDSFRLRINISTTPNTVTISGASSFRLSPATFSVDSAQILVTDNFGAALAGFVPTFTVVAKPTGATGESITYTPTDAGGISRLNLLAGNVAGVYVVKAVVGALSPVYIGFHTLEYDQPATLWRLIAVNRVPTNATVSQALSGLAPTSIFHWNPSIADHAINRRYEIPTSFVSGDGYYIRNAVAVRYSVNGATLVTDTRDIAIKEGWNMVGTPFANLTRWNASQIVSSGGTVMTVAAAEAAGIIQNKIFWYKDNAYQFGPSATNVDPILTPWNGFWLKANTAATLRLSPYFYFSEASAPLASAQAVGTTSDWTAKLTVRGDGGNEFSNLFGASSTASTVENPPIVSGQFAGGLGVSGAFAQEMKPPFTTAQRWDFTVTPTTTDNIVTLTFSDLGNLPPGFVALLVDLSNGAQTTLLTTPTYQFNAGGLAQSRSFRILAGTEAQVRALAIPALSTSQTFVTPNPGPDGAGNVVFKYNATAGGTLKLRVFDLGGRNVIDRTIDLNTFPTEYSWNCRNEQGQSISTGVYVYVLDYAAPTEKRRITEKLVIFR